MEELQQIGLAEGRALRLDHDDLDALLAGRRTDMLRLEGRAATIDVEEQLLTYEEDPDLSEPPADQEP